MVDGDLPDFSNMMVSVKLARGLLFYGLLLAKIYSDTRSLGNKRVSVTAGGGFKVLI